MRKILAIAWNDVPRGVFGSRHLDFLSGAAAGIYLIIGQGLQQLYGSPDEIADQRIALLVVDADRSSLSNELITIIESSHSIQPLVKPAAEAQALIDEQQAAAVLTIPFGFERALVTGQPVNLSLEKLPNDTRALAIDQALAAAMISGGQHGAGCPEQPVPG